MKIEQVPCGECGILIPEVTAQRTRGLCVPCKMRLTKSDPFQDFYKALVDRIDRYPNGFVSLTEPEKLYFALTLFRDEVHAGGFQQYFAGSAGFYYEFAEKGVEAIGAKRLLGVLREVKEFLFPEIAVPADVEQRRRILRAPKPGITTSQWTQKMDEFHNRFEASSEYFSERLKVYARQHRLVSEHDLVDG
jgi:hypothetical protein